MSEAAENTTTKRKLQCKRHTNSERIGGALCLAFCALGIAIPKDRN